MDTYIKEGIVIDIKETQKFNDWFSKREFKIRYTEEDLANKIVEQKIKFVAQDVETIDALDGVRIDDQVKIKFFISGTDRAKKDNPEVIMNFTNLVAISVEILGSPTRDTKKDKDAVITNETRVYKDPLVEATTEELAGLVTGKELEDLFQQNRDKYGLVNEPEAAPDSMKSKILNKEEDPFSNIEEKKEELSDLPF